MSLPAGITTATVTVGVPVTFTGAAVKTFVSIEPSVFLVHAATGTPLVDFLEEMDISEGVAGQYALPHTDQTGFIDESGNAYTNWYYTARVTYSTPSKAKTKSPKVKVFQLTTGQTSVDLDLLPAGAPALPYIAPAATVTAFQGRTGAVALEESDLPERLTDESLDATYAPVTGSAIYARADQVPLRASGSRFRTITVMTYHLINMTNFNIDLDFYQEWNYTTVAMDEIQAHLDGTSTLPGKPLVISFDDGIASQYAAAQELNARGMKGTWFIATGWIDGTVTQAQGGFAEATALTWTQLNQMKTWGMEIQSHTVNHQDQTTITPTAVAAEFTNSKSRIEAQVTGQIVSHLAYPYGAWNAAVKTALLGAGCKLARVVRIAPDGSYPGANKGRLAIATTQSPRLEIPTSGTGNGDIQQPNYYRTLSSDPELVADFGFEAGGKGWQLGSGFTIDTAEHQTGTRSLKFTQTTSTASSKPLRAINAGRWPRMQLKAWIKTVGLPSGTITKVQIQQLRPDASVISTIDAITVTGNNGAWTEYTYELVGDAACDSVVVYAWGQGNASPTGAAWWDNISLKKESANAPFGGLY